MDLSIKKQIAQHTQEYLKMTRCTQVQLCNLANVPKEYLSQILKEGTDFTLTAGSGKLVIIADKYFEKIANAIGLELTKSFWQNRKTPQLTSIISNLQDAKMFGTTALIIGETGAGKTHAIDLIQKKYPSDTYIVKVGSTDNLTDLIDKVVDTLKITAGKTKSKKLRDIAKKLRSVKDDGLKPQLIFDEAEYMKQPALCSMKELHDYLNDHASVVLVGTNQLLDNLNHLRRKNKAGMPQYYRRIKFSIRILPSIDRSFELFLNDESTDVKKYLRTICDNYGELHDVLVPVRREAERLEEPVTVNLIKTVLNITNNFF